MLILKCHVFNIYCLFFSLALVDLIFLIMMVIKNGICYGIMGQENHDSSSDAMPLWLKIIYPYFIEPVFYISRLCTVYMVVVVSLERFHAVYSPLLYNTRCRYYIPTAVFFSSKACFITCKMPLKKINAIFFFFTC